MAKSLLVALALLPVTVVTLATALAVGPKQQAAIDKCRGTFEEQQRSCRQSSNSAACITMYTQQYNECMADAQTIVEVEPGSPKGPKDITTNKAGSQPKADH